MTTLLEPAMTAAPATAAAPAAGTDPRRTRPLGRLFLISFVILFLELACIRWFGSTVVFLTFFTNLVLMACFLGMSVGCLAASRKSDLVNGVIPLLFVSVVLANATLVAYNQIGRLTIDVGRQTRAQEIFFGTEVRPADPSQFVVPVEAVAGLFFVLIALLFVGLGQEMGRCFNAIPDRVAAYTINVLGSLVGIVAFGAASWLRTPPLVWFAVAVGLVLMVVTTRRTLQTATAAAVVVALFGSSFGPGLLQRTPAAGHAGAVKTVWSPYYKIHYQPEHQVIYTNNIAHQNMLSYTDDGQAYALPHLLNRDAGGQPFRNVMIVGAGSGNDVAAALRNGAARVDAVEIDRAIFELGQAYHPDRPYDDPRVVPHFDDGRAFVHNTDRRFDLITYALVDSLVLHSGYSNLRLESFLFTEQAFRDIKAKLEPDGVFAMYNYYRQGWVVGRLVTLIEKVFGVRPIVITIPYQEVVKPGDNRSDSITFLLVGNTGSNKVEAIRRQFAEKKFFWSFVPPAANGPISGFAPTSPRPAQPSFQIGPATVDATGFRRLSSDAWPFLYLREPAIPALNLRGMALIAVLSLAVLLVFAPVRRLRPNGQMAFLGAGFMLLETKGVVHMALLFGSTWVVNSFVFFAILVMILLSNLFVHRVRPKTLWPYYALLTAALVMNVVVPMSAFLALPGAARVVVSCLVVFVPVFFAGVIFATAFRDSTQPDVDFGSNIAGVIVGGLSENLSLVLGFNNLILLAIAFYALSALLRPRLRLATA